MCSSNAGVEPIGFLLHSSSVQDSRALESTCKHFLNQTHLFHCSTTPKSAAMVLFCAAEGEGKREGSVQLEAFHVDLATFQRHPLQIEVTQVTEWMNREVVSVRLTASLSVDMPLSHLSGILHKDLPL